MSILTYPAAVNPQITGLLAIFAEGIMASRPRDQLIDREGDPYIERWYLARKTMVPGNNPAGSFADAVPLIPSEMENLYLHRYVRADVEEPHCHPWANATCVLAGWYTEDVYEAGVHIGSFRRNPGDVVIRRAGEIHAITGCKRGTISLFATMRKEREWGFHTAEGFIPWADFRSWKNARVAAADWAPGMTSVMSDGSEPVRA